MASTTDLLTRNVDVLRSRVNRYGIYGLVLSLATILIASMVVGFQMTGTVSIAAMLLAQQENFALRLLDLMPFVFTFWGQYTGTVMAYQASAMIVEQTDDLRSETTAWKKKSLHESTHDPLTDLPNRVLFYDRLQQAIPAAGREERFVAVLFIDLDGFREVNDAFGPYNGDQILKLVAARLRAQVPAADTVARMGGDEFALLLEVPDREVAMQVAQRVHKSLESAFELNRTHIEISASIGIAVWPEHGRDADALVQRAEAAMAAAKRRTDGCCFYSEGLALDNPRRLMLMSELRRAIDEDSLELHFQPKLDIRTGRITGAEALVRWNHAQHGRISPQEFVPLAERTRLIRPLTGWLIHRAVETVANWRSAGLLLSVSINISARDVEDPALVNELAEALRSHGAEAQWITLEITEGSVMADARRSLEALKQLHGAGFRLSVDDFGTGYSSLAYLSRLPVNELKIDKSFVMGMEQHPGDRTIVESTIDLGHNLGLEVVAEGVESEAALGHLGERGCDIAQGYFISPPLAEGDFRRWVAESRRGKA